jgi:4-amino-4-deoxy-L-arabinose transferase-like glycosyltransferase
MDRWAKLELSRGGGFGLVAFAAGLLLFPNAGGFALLDPNEAKHALIARHMLEEGRWLEPILNGALYHDKPSFFYILVGACYRIFGVSEFSARLVPCLSVWGTLLLTYALASKRSVPAGILSAYFLGSSLFFIHMGRFTNLDGLFTLALTGALFPALAVMPARGAWRIPYVSFVSLAFAILIKGPVAGVLTAVPAAVAIARFELDWKRVVRGVLLLLAIVAAWVVPVAIAHPDYLVDFVWLHNLQRYFGDVPVFHPEPILFFIPIVFGALLPWSPLLPYAVLRAFRRPSADLLLAAYALGIVAFFSLSTGKLATYVVPAFPALAVLVAWWSWAGLSEPGSRARDAALVGEGFLVVLVPVGVVAAYVAAPELVIVSLCLVPMGLVAAGVLFARARFQSGTEVAVAACIGCLCSSLLLCAFGGPGAARFTSDRDLAEQALALGPPDRMVIYRVRPFSFLFYTGWKAAYKVSDEAYKAAITGPGDVLVLTKAKRLEPLGLIVPGVRFVTVARNRRHLLLRPIREQSQ